MTLAARIAALLIVGLSSPMAASAGECLGPETATVIQQEFTLLFGDQGGLESMSVLEDGLTVTVAFEGVLYDYRAFASGPRALTFAHVSPSKPPQPLEELMVALARQLPPTIWRPCGDQKPKESRSGFQLLTANDLSELPPEACRPAPGHVCSDVYWTLPPRLSYAGAVATYSLHVAISLGLLLAGFLWFRRSAHSPATNASQTVEDNL
jgi:hypothetical protein